MLLARSLAIAGVVAAMNWSATTAPLPSTVHQAAVSAVLSSASLAAVRTAGDLANAPRFPFALKAGAGRATGITCTTYPCPAGYFWYYFTDPDCPGNPDTFEAYVEYWNSDESFNYDVDAGHATYTCDSVYKPSTVGSSSAYQDCVANSPWNCQDLGYTWNNHP